MIVFSITLILKYAQYHTNVDIARNLNGSQTVVYTEYNKNELQFIKKKHPKTQYVLSKFTPFVYKTSVYPILVRAMPYNFFSEDALKFCDLKSCNNKLKNGEVWIDEGVYNELSMKINDKIYINGKVFIVKGFAKDNLTYSNAKLWDGSSIFITQDDATKYVKMRYTEYFFSISKHKVLEEKLFDNIRDIYDQNSPNFYGHILNPYLKYIESLKWIIYMYLIIHFFSISFTITSFTYIFTRFQFGVTP